MTIKQQGGVFGRNPTFNDVEIEGNLTVGGSEISTVGSIASQDADSINIDGGAIDGVTLGTNSAITDARIDNVKIDGNTISTTNTDGDLTLEPNGDGYVQVYDASADARLMVRSNRNSSNGAALVAAFGVDANGQRASFANNAWIEAAYSNNLTRHDTNKSAFAINTYNLKSAYEGQSFLAIDYISAGGTQTRVLEAKPTFDVNINNGNLKIGTSGNGIDFSATSDASGSTSELFSDYEEGTWSPAVADALTGGNSATLSVANGYYTKVGNLVHVQAKITLSSKGSMTAGNSVYIRGLPFTSANSTNGATTFSILCNGVTTIGNYVTSLMDENSTTFRLFDSGSGVNFILVSEITDTTQFVIGGTYRTA